MRCGVPAQVSSCYHAKVTRYIKCYAATANTYAAIYNGILQRGWFAAQARNYPSTLAASLDGKLKRGVVVRSRSVTAFVSEGQIAKDLGAIQGRYPRVDVGSYPFQRQDRFGTTLVMRGSDAGDLDAALAEVVAMIRTLGAEPEDIQEG